MFKKLFSRNKTKAPVRAEKKTVAAPEQPQTLAQWASKIEAAQGKSQAQLLSKLAEQVQQNSFSAAEAVAALNGLPAAMFAVSEAQNTDSISDEQWLALVTQGHTAKVRKAAAERMSDGETIAQLVKAVKGKDKTVYRILHDKLEVIEVEQKQAQAKLDKTHAVLDAIAKLANAPFEPMYEAKLKGLQDQWQALAVELPELNEKFAQAEQAAQAKIDALVAEELANKAKAESVKMADSNRQALIDQLTERLLQRIEAFVVSDEMVSEDQRLLSDLQHQWREIDQHSKASKDEVKAFQKVSTAFEVSLARLKTLVEKYGDAAAMVATLNDADQEKDALLHDVDDWLNSIEQLNLAAPMPQPVVNLKQALDQFQQSLAEHRQQDIERVRALRSQMRRCLSAVEEGSLRRASGLYHGVEEKLEGFDVDAHPSIRKQLDETTEALEKLRDWQSYAVLPKKEALIKRMQNLTEHSMDPEARATAIREMQDEWKSLSRGLQNRQQELWDTFHELAQKAYEPCVEYFSEQRNLREINLERRKEVVEQLNTYSDMINWEKPDLKEVERVLQVARNDWRHYSPVDRVANKPIQQTFDKMHQGLYDRLRKEQDVFKVAKQAIIEQAKQLLELEDSREATAQAKTLQRQWKEAGIVARKDEQALWKDFREVCDAIFAKREQQVAEFKADLDTNKDKAEALLASLEELAGAEAVLAQQSVFESLRGEFQQVGTLPKAHIKKLNQRFQTACQQFEQAAKQAKLAAADQHWVDLIAWVKSVRFSGQDQASALAQWVELKVPSEANVLKAAIADWLKPADELNHAALHEKTIDLEIATDSETPLVDSQMRMNLQVQRLSEGFGGRTSDADVSKQVVEWLAIGAVEQEAYEALEARMIAARSHWLK